MSVVGVVTRWLSAALLLGLFGLGAGIPEAHAAVGASDVVFKAKGGPGRLVIGRSGLTVERRGLFRSSSVVYPYDRIASLQVDLRLFSGTVMVVMEGDRPDTAQIKLRRRDAKAAREALKGHM